MFNRDPLLLELRADPERVEQPFSVYEYGPVDLDRQDGKPNLRAVDDYPDCLLGGGERHAALPPVAGRHRIG